MEWKYGRRSSTISNFFSIQPQQNQTFLICVDWLMEEMLSWLNKPPRPPAAHSLTQFNFIFILQIQLNFLHSIAAASEPQTKLSLSLMKEESCCFALRGSRGSNAPLKRKVNFLFKLRRWNTFIKKKLIEQEEKKCFSFLYYKSNLIWLSNERK